MNTQCKYCPNTNSLTEIYVGDNLDEDEKEYICPTCLEQEMELENIGFCQLCGNGIAYYDDDLDAKSLCNHIHKGEFDYSAEEEQDMEDFIEYNTKDG
jgi:hypothetical protein